MIDHLRAGRHTGHRLQTAAGDPTQDEGAQPPSASATGPDEQANVVEELVWPEPLFEFQRVAVRALVDRPVLLLADDMGLGKTVTAIAALRVLHQRENLTSALIVVPAGLIDQWRRALRRWGPELAVSTVRGPTTDRAWQWRARAQVFLVGYETLRSDFGASRSSPPRRRTWNVVVLDEAQKIKNAHTETASVCKQLPRSRAWALTGTPLENRLDDLASICEFLRPWTEGDRPLHLQPGPSLRERHLSLQLRRRKHDVLSELPPKTVVPVRLQLGAEQRRTYDRAENEGVVRLRALGRDVRIANVLELITRLKQITNVCPESGQSVKLDDLVERMAVLAAEDHRALVFSQYTSVEHGVGAIADRCARFDPLVYTGAMSAAQRDRTVQRFKTDPSHRVLVLSVRAGGYGLNLQEASYVVHFDHWWNPAVERQAEDRTHRMGQELPVTVYRYLCDRTIEERIEEILASKQRLFDTHVDLVSLDLAESLSAAELFGLFGLHPPRGPATEG